MSFGGLVSRSGSRKFDIKLLAFSHVHSTLFVLKRWRRLMAVLGILSL